MSIIAPWPSFIWHSARRPTVLEIADDCDASGEEGTWDTDRHLHLAAVPTAGRGIISADTEKAFRHKEKTEPERKEILDELRTWYGEVNE